MGLDSVFVRREPSLPDESRSIFQLVIGPLLVGFSVSFVGLVAVLFVLPSPRTDAWIHLSIALVSLACGAFVALVLQSRRLQPLLRIQRILRELAAARPHAASSKRPHELEEARRLRDELQELRALRTRLLRALSHDMRTPISSVQMANLMLREELEQNAVDHETVRRMTGIIEKASRFQMEMVENLLAFSQDGTSSSPVRSDAITIATLLTTVAGSMQLRAQEKDIRLTTSIAPSVPTVIYSDRTKLEQIMTNLLSNAIKFTGNGGSVEIGAAREDDGLELFVADDGIGIADEHRRHLFDAFTVNQRLGTHKEKGFGLGLWVSRSYADMLGGTMRVESRPGDGSRFSLLLPHEAVADTPSAGSS